MKKTMQLEKATEKQHKDWVKEHAKMKTAFDKADSKNNNNKTKQYADNSYKPSITMKVDGYETENVLKPGMTLSERKSAMVKAIEGMKSEFYRNNFDK
jgi:hypothetical protein